MRLFPLLWHRVFGYAILLVIVVHIVSFAVFRLGAEKNMQVRFATEIVSSAALAIADKDREALEALVQFFNQPPRKLWIELPDGEIIGGEPSPGSSFADRRSMTRVSSPKSPVAVMRGDATEKAYLAETAVRLKDGDAIVCIRFEDVPHPPISALFIQGLMAVCIIGGALSIWITWRISRPLRKLRMEVLQMAEGDLEARVGEQGPEEIAQVAKAVNSMAHSLSQSIKSMRELVANISHEIRSPLARMNISAAIIEEGLTALTQKRGNDVSDNGEKPPQLILDAAGAPLAVTHVGYLLQEIVHMEKLVGSSLLSGRLDLQAEALELKSVDMSMLCMDMSLRYEPMFAEKKLSITVDVQPNIWVSGDEALLSLVLSNLLDNVVKYADKGGFVRLYLDSRDGYARLRLENSHSRLEDAVLAQLFDPFFRGIPTGDSCGAGLGLTLVKKIAGCHNGDAAVENCDAGLRFSILLPCIDVGDPDFITWFFDRHATAM